MAAQMLHLRLLTHAALAVPGLGLIWGASHGAAARLNAPWHGRLLVRE
jgi:hypothetical protein